MRSSSGYESSRSENELQTNLRRSATEARLGLDSGHELEFGFEFEFEFDFDFDFGFKLKVLR